MTEPALSPHEKKQRLIASYVRTNETYAVEQPVSEIEAMVVSDCQMIDAADARGEIRGTSPGPVDPEAAAALAADRDAALDRMLEDRGMRQVQEVRAWHPDLLYASYVDERWGYARGRLNRILSDGTEPTAAGPMFVGACGPYAYRIVETYALWRFRNWPAAIRGFQKNPFDGHGDDAGLLIMRRRLEDICDASTGVLGSWYVR